MTKDEQYFIWLKNQIAPEYGRRTSHTYEGLFTLMYSKEFVWIIPNDDNRVEDGLDLRTEFLGGGHYDVLQQGVSILEVLVALSRRLAFNADGAPELWAWRLIDNLGLAQYKDRLRTGIDRAAIDDILDQMIWRQFERDGRGSFFPLRYAREDQTKTELWYQMNAYINENTDM
jgi:hypothetical protein